MNRLARRLTILKGKREGSFDAEQHHLELALRGRTARKVRTHLRRMDPVCMLTPRWSRPQSFLEDLALDLAVGEPGVSCRTISLRPLKGRSEGECWNFLLRVLAQLYAVSWNEARAPQPASRLGFRTAVETLLERTQNEAIAPMALLSHGAEYVPWSVLDDLSQAWARFAEAHPEERRVTLLLSGTVEAPAMHLEEAPRIVLADYGEAEAAAAIVGRAGPAARAQLEAAARFTGGMPALVDALGFGARARGSLPRSQSGMVRALGTLSDELRGALEIAASDPLIAERLELLSKGEPVVEVPEVDQPLKMAGLIRYSRRLGEDTVQLRAPALVDLLS